MRWGDALFVMENYRAKPEAGAHPKLYTRSSATDLEWYVEPSD
jgi:hypothetical protein